MYRSPLHPSFPLSDASKHDALSEASVSRISSGSGSRSSSGNSTPVSLPPPVTPQTIGPMDSHPDDIVSTSTMDGVAGMLSGLSGAQVDQLINMLLQKNNLQGSDSPSLVSPTLSLQPESPRDIATLHPPPVSTVSNVVVSEDTLSSEQIISDLRQRVQLLELQNAGLLAEKTRLVDENAREIQSLHHTITGLRMEKSHIESMNVQLNDKITELEVEIAQVIRKTDSPTAVNSASELQLRNLLNSNEKNLRDRQIQYEQEKKELTARLNAAESRYTELWKNAEGKQAMYTHDCEKYMEKIEKQSQYQFELEKKLKESEDQRKLIHSQNIEMLSHMDSASGGLSWMTEKADLLNKLKLLNTENNQVYVIREKLETENAAMKLEVATINIEKNHLQVQIDHLVQERHDLQISLNHEKEALLKLTNEINLEIEKKVQASIDDANVKVSEANMKVNDADVKRNEEVLEALKSVEDADAAAKLAMERAFLAEQRQDEISLIVDEYSHELAKQNEKIEQLELIISQQSLTKNEKNFSESNTLVNISSSKELSVTDLRNDNISINKVSGLPQSQSQSVSSDYSSASEDSETDELLTRLRQRNQELMRRVNNIHRVNDSSSTAGVPTTTVAIPVLPSSVNERQEHARSEQIVLLEQDRADLSIENSRLKNKMMELESVISSVSDDSRTSLLQISLKDEQNRRRSVEESLNVSLGQCYKLTAELSRLQQEIDTLAAAKDSEMIRRRKVEASYNELQNSFEEVSSTRHRLEAQCNSYSREIDILRQEAAKLNTDDSFNLLHKRNKALTEQLRHESVERAQLDDEMYHLRQKIKSLEDENFYLKDSNNNSRKIVPIELLDSIKLEAATNLGLLNQKESECLHLKREVETIREDLQRMWEARRVSGGDGNRADSDAWTAFDKLKRRHDASVVERSRMEVEFSRLTNLYDKSQKSMVRIEESWRESKERMNGIQSRIRLMDVDVKSLFMEVRSLDTRATIVREALTVVESSFLNMSQNASSILNGPNDLSSSARLEIKLLEEKIAMLESERENLRAELEDLLFRRSHLSSDQQDRDRRRLDLAAEQAKSYEKSMAELRRSMMTTESDLHAAHVELEEYTRSASLREAQLQKEISMLISRAERSEKDVLKLKSISQESFMNKSAEVSALRAAVDSLQEDKKNLHSTVREAEAKYDALREALESRSMSFHAELEMLELDRSRVDSQLKQLEKQCHEQSIELDNVRDERDSLSRQLQANQLRGKETIEKTIESLTCELDSMRLKLAEIQSSYRTVEMELENWRQRCLTAARDRDDATSLRTRAEIELSGVRMALSEAESQRDRYRDEIEKSRYREHGGREGFDKQLEQLNNNLTNAENKNIQYEKSIAILEGEKASVERRIIDLDADKEWFKKRLSDVEADRNRLWDEVRSREEGKSNKEVEFWKNRATDAESEKESAKAECTRQFADITALKSRVDSLMSQSDRHRNDLCINEKELSIVNIENDQLKNEVISVNESLRLCRREYESAKDVSVRISGESAALKERVNELEDIRQRLVDDIAGKDRRISALVMENDDLTSENNFNRGKLSSFESRLREHELIVNDRNSRIRLLEQHQEDSMNEIRRMRADVIGGNSSLRYLHKQKSETELTANELREKLNKQSDDHRVLLSSFESKIREYEMTLSSRNSKIQTLEENLNLCEEEVRRMRIDVVGGNSSLRYLHRVKSDTECTLAEVRLDLAEAERVIEEQRQRLTTMLDGDDTIRDRLVMTLDDLSRVREEKQAVSHANEILRSELNSAVGKWRELSQTEAELQTSVLDRDRLIESLTRTSEGLRNLLSSKELELKQLCEAMSLCRSENCDLSTRLKRQSMEMNNIVEESKKYLSVIDDLRETLTDKDEMMLSRTDDRKALSVSLHQKDAEYKDLYNEFENYKVSSNKTKELERAEFDVMSTELERLRGEMSRQSQELTTALNSINELTTREKSSMDSIDSLRESLAAKDKMISELTVLSERLHAAEQYNKEDIEVLSAAHTEMANEVESKLELIKNLRELNGKKESEMAELQQLVEILHADIRHKEMEFHEAIDTKDRLIESLTRTSEGLRNLLSSKELELKQLCEAMSLCRSENCDLSTRLKRQSMEMNNIVEESKKYLSVIDDLRETLTDKDEMMLSRTDDRKALSVSLHQKDAEYKDLYNEFENYKVSSNKTKELERAEFDVMSTELERLRGEMSRQSQELTTALNSINELTTREKSSMNSIDSLRESLAAKDKMISELTVLSERLHAAEQYNTEDIEVLSAAHTEMANEVESKLELIKNLRELNGKKESEMAELQQLVEKLRGELRRKNSVVNDTLLASTKQLLEQEVATSMILRQNLEDSNSALVSTNLELSSLSSQIKQLRDLISVGEHENNLLREEILSFEDSENSLSAEVESLRGLQEVSEKKIAFLMQHLESRETSVSNFEKQLQMQSTSDNKSEHLLFRIQEQALTIDRLQESLREEVDSGRALKDQLSSGSKLLEILGEQNDKLLDDIDRLKSDLQNDDFKRQATALTLELQSKNRDYEDLMNHLTNLKDLVSVGERENSRMNNIIIELEESEDMLISKLDASTLEINNRKIEIESLRTKIQNTVIDIDETSMENNVLRAKLKELENSFLTEIQSMQDDLQTALDNQEQVKTDVLQSSLKQEAILNELNSVRQQLEPLLASCDDLSIQRNVLNKRLIDMEMLLINLKTQFETNSDDREVSNELNALRKERDDALHRLIAIEEVVLSTTSESARMNDFEQTCKAQSLEIVRLRSEIEEEARRLQDVSTRSENFKDSAQIREQKLELMLQENQQALSSLQTSSLELEKLKQEEIDRLELALQLSQTEASTLREKLRSTEERVGSRFSDDYIASVTLKADRFEADVYKLQRQVREQNAAYEVKDAEVNGLLLQLTQLQEELDDERSLPRERTPTRVQFSSVGGSGGTMLDVETELHLLKSDVKEAQLHISETDYDDGKTIKLSIHEYNVMAKELDWLRIQLESGLRREVDSKVLDLELRSLCDDLKQKNNNLIGEVKILKEKLNIFSEEEKKIDSEMEQMQLQYRQMEIEIFNIKSQKGLLSNQSNQTVEMLNSQIQMLQRAQQDLTEVHASEIDYFRSLLRKAMTAGSTSESSKLLSDLLHPIKLEHSDALRFIRDNIDETFNEESLNPIKGSHSIPNSARARAIATAGSDAAFRAAENIVDMLRSENENLRSRTLNAERKWAQIGALFQQGIENGDDHSNNDPRMSSSAISLKNENMILRDRVDKISKDCICWGESGVALRRELNRLRDMFGRYRSGSIEISAATAVVFENARLRQIMEQWELELRNKADIEGSRDREREEWMRLKHEWMLASESWDKERITHHETMKSTIESMTRERQGADERIHSLREEIQRIRALGAASESQLSEAINRLENEKKSLQEEVVRLKGVGIRLGDELEKHRVALSEKETSDTEKIISILREENITKDNQIATSTSELENIRKKSLELEQTIFNLKNHVSSFQVELHDRNETIEQLTFQLETAQGQEEYLVKEIAELSRKIELLTDDGTENWKKKYQELQDIDQIIIGNLKDEILHWKHLVNDVNDQKVLNELMSKLEISERSRFTLESELSQLRSELENLRREIEDRVTQKDWDAVVSHRDQLLSECDMLKSQQRDISLEQHNSLENVNSLQEQLNECRLELENAKNQLNEVTSLLSDSKLKEKDMKKKFQNIVDSYNSLKLKFTELTNIHSADMEKAKKVKTELNEKIKFLGDALMAQERNVSSLNANYKKLEDQLMSSEHTIVSLRQYVNVNGLNNDLSVRAREEILALQKEVRGWKKRYEDSLTVQKELQELLTAVK